MRNGDWQIRVQNILDLVVRDGTERGLQVAVYREGELVVDAWSGVADHRSGQPVDGDTLFPVFSVSKGIAATLIHQLVERGKLSLDAPLADVWPEFATKEKENITLRQGLNHSAGLPHMPDGIGISDLGDWERMSAAVADLRPISAPGLRAEYHAITFGWIVGEPACRVTGHTFVQLLREQITQPLGLDGMYIGIPDDVAARVAFLEEENPPTHGVEGEPAAVPAWVGPLHELMNRPGTQRACMPASSGIMNARSLARHYAALLPGGVDGVELLSPSCLSEALQPQGLQTTDGAESKWALGYALMPEYSSRLGKGVAFGHGGYGGSIGFADPSARLAVGFAKNRFGGGNALELILQELQK